MTFMFWEVFLGSANTKYLGEAPEISVIFIQALCILNVAVRPSLTSAKCRDKCINILGLLWKCVSA